MAFRVVKNRPYQLVGDLSFNTTDRIARDLLGERFNEFDKERVLGAINCLLHKAALGGNCGASFIKRKNILQCDYAFDGDMITEAALYGSMLDDVVQDQWRDRAVVFQSKSYAAERALTEFINEPVRKEEQHNGGEAATVSEIACSSEIVLTDAQVQAVKNAIAYPLSIITGGPGTGNLRIGRPRSFSHFSSDWHRSEHNSSTDPVASRRQPILGLRS